MVIINEQTTWNTGRISRHLKLRKISQRWQFRPFEGAVVSVCDYEIPNCHVKYFEEHFQRMLYKGYILEDAYVIFKLVAQKNPFWLPEVRESLAWESSELFVE